jgi:hypothetical protein
MHRYLKVLITTTCGLAGVFVVVLWARSYIREDRASGHISNVGIRFYSSRGWIVCFKNSAIGPNQYPWSISLGSEHWLAPNDSRLGFSSPVDFFGSAATSHISLPHWAALIALMVLPSITWIDWKLRFSLRTLLLGMTVIAVLFGIVAGRVLRNG